MHFVASKAVGVVFFLVLFLVSSSCVRQRGQEGDEPRVVAVDRSKCVVIIGDDTGPRDTAIGAPFNVNNCTEDNTAEPVIVEVPAATPTTP